MQVERIENMQVGDFIELPAGEWDLNLVAKSMFAQAQQVMDDYQGDGLRPQYQIHSYPRPGEMACLLHQLQRIR
jgi:hypothetical protein